MPAIILVTGGCGFIGSAVARRLSKDGHRVRVADNHPPSGELIPDVEYCIGNLRDATFSARVVKDSATVLHFAANMGGMGTIHSANDLALYEDNHHMTLRLLDAAQAANIQMFFYASSACVYPERPIRLSKTSNDISFREEDVWATGIIPDTQGLYGLDKLNTELVLSQYKTRFDIRIARFHNIFGPGGAWYNGREKAPAALLRKALVARRIRDKNEGGLHPSYEIWGDGNQRRSFLYIDDCVAGILALLASDCDTPVNIGSDRAVPIIQLAEIALNCVGLSANDVTFIYNSDKPLGVSARNSDNSFALQILNPWSPTTTLEDGMRTTCAWMSGELDKLSASGFDTGSALSDALGQSQLIDFNTAITFAILLPITSRLASSQDSCLENLRIFKSSLMRTTQSDRLGTSGCKVSFSLKVYLLIDHDDTHLLRRTAGMNQAERVFVDTDIPVTTLLGYHEPGRVCSLWRQCARKAYEDPGNTYLVLFGDDVELVSNEWMSKIHHGFESIAEDTGAPVGFGCVAFRDLSFPGMPTFPVVHRTHLDIFGGEVIPDTFVNQDGDPFLFQLYRRWGASRMLMDVELRNTIGGSVAARYEKQRTSGWTYELLDRATAITTEWVLAQKLDLEAKLTIDVVVPSFRVDIALLEGILALKPSPAVSTMFIIIVDDPVSKAADELELRYSHRTDVRIRRNSTNVGASASRNRGMEESAADWIVFLDDDVQPEPDLLLKAEESVRAHPEAAGFVGNVYFPPADTIYTSAVHLSGVTYFWNIAEKITDDVPWGVTANLMARRNNDGIVFDLGFPKTGGGEDIDFCVRKRRDGFVFFAAPNIRVVHPWWRNGRRDYARFYGWGFGDSGLLQKFPQSTYRDYSPNSAELLLVAIILAAVGALTGRLDLVLLAAKIALSTSIANFLHDLYRLLYLQDFDVKAMPGDRKHRELVAGPSRVFAVIESTVIRMFSEAGKTVGVLTRGDLLLLGLRFDWFIGRWQELPRHNERMNGVQRFLFMSIVLAMLESPMFV